MDSDGLGLLLTLPLESVAVRAVLASATGVLLLRLLLRVGIRSVGARVAMALAPAGALLTVVLVSSRSGLDLPSVMLPAEAVDALPIPVTDGYLHFAPIAVPLLVSAWAIVAGVRAGRRALANRRELRSARAALLAGTAPPALTALVARLARGLRVTVPAVAVVSTCPGGAYVAGIRRPVVVVGSDLLERLDDEELEGVLAHELAHVRRRDNLVATTLGIIRDLTFFVPGGGWAFDQLRRERERAADQAAVATTTRPGALASGLLKTLEGPEPAHPCAALAPSATVVERVRDLVEDPPPVSRLRRSSELAAVGGVAVIAAVVAVALPAALTGAERERDAVAVVFSAPNGGPTEAATPAAELRAFDVYRRTRLEVEGPRPPATTRMDESSTETRRSTWRACADPETCPDPDDGVGLGLVPRPTITLDDDLASRWEATPAFSTRPGVDGVRLPALYWLQRVS